MEKKRLFLGIPVNAQLEESLVKFQLQQLYDPKVNWVPANNLHITLNFIGDYPKSETHSLKEKLFHCFKNYHSFTIGFNQFELMPRQNPYMVWALFQNHPAFTELSKGLATLLGTQVKNKPLPHITLARFKAGADYEAINLKPEIQVGELKVSKIHLYESVLKPGGAEYHILETYLL